MRLKKLGNNMHELQVSNKLVILFSYETPVAVRKNALLHFSYYVTQEEYSPTTTRHIEDWLLGDPRRDKDEKPMVVAQIWIDSLLWDSRGVR